jgi:hypothetical protein
LDTVNERSLLLHALSQLDQSDTFSSGIEQTTSRITEQFTALYNTASTPSERYGLLEGLLALDKVKDDPSSLQLCMVLSGSVCVSNLLRLLYGHGKAVQGQCDLVRTRVALGRSKGNCPVFQQHGHVPGNRGISPFDVLASRSYSKPPRIDLNWTYQHALAATDSRIPPAF